MKRRGFFSTLLAPLALFAKAETRTKPNGFEYRGFIVMWYEYLNGAENAFLLGKWVALDERRHVGFYATTHGVVDRFNRGMTLNLMRLDSWPEITEQTPKHTRDAVKERARVQLLRFVDYNLDKGEDAIQPKYYEVPLQMGDSYYYQYRFTHSGDK